MVDQVKKTEVVALEKAMEGARRATGIGFSNAGAAASEPSDPEVLEKANRRRFTAKYKLDILEEAEHCEAGQIGALLRREGLYSSHLTNWRRQRETGALEALGPRKRGRKPKVQDARAQRVMELERENERLRQRLEQAETIIEVQKKVSSLLGITLNPPKRAQDA
jgi:transposase-like protein